MSMRAGGLLLALALPGCEGMSLEEHELASRGLTQEDLDAPPSDHEIRAAITRDIRQVWIPEGQLDRGLSSCPGMRVVEGKTVCATEEAVLKEFKIRVDSPDRQYPVEETAYFCPEEKHYWYHYVGGPDRRDTWLGPRKVKLRPPKGY